MNSFTTIDTNYISSSRTIETILINNEINKSQKLVYVYNYEGIHYRFFESLLELINFFAENSINQNIIEFSQDNELDSFLASYKFS